MFQMMYNSAAVGSRHVLEPRRSSRKETIGMEMRPSLRELERLCRFLALRLTNTLYTSQGLGALKHALPSK